MTPLGLSSIRFIFFCSCGFCVIIWLICDGSCSQRHKVHCSFPEIQLLLLWWKHKSLYHHSEPEWTSQLLFQHTIITAWCLSSIHDTNSEENTNYHVERSWTTSRKCFSPSSFALGFYCTQWPQNKSHDHLSAPKHQWKYDKPRY